MQLDTPPNDALNQLLKISNRVVKAFGQLPLYETAQSSLGTKRKRARVGATPPIKNESIVTSSDNDMASKFHISIGWTLNPPSPGLIEAVSRVTELGEIKVSVSAVKAKVGNGINSIPLASMVDARHSILEKG